jgi:hypothetical protein
MYTPSQLPVLFGYPFECDYINISASTPQIPNEMRGGGLEQGGWTESIEWFIEDQDFSSSYFPLPSYPSPVSKLDWRHTGRLRKRDNLMTVEGEGGERRARSYDGKKAWSSINNLITLWGWNTWKFMQKLSCKAPPCPTHHSCYFYQTITLLS